MISLDSLPTVTRPTTVSGGVWRWSRLSSSAWSGCGEDVVGRLSAGALLQWYNTVARSRELIFRFKYESQIKQSMAFKPRSRLKPMVCP